MQDKYIKVTPVLRNIVINYLHSEGYKKVGDDILCKYIAFNLDTKLYTDVWTGKAVSFEELLKLVEEYKEPPITVGGMDVKFEKDGIEVGCQYVSHEELKEINNHLIKKYGFVLY